MPSYPVCSGKQIVTALERLGFEQKRQRGSHVVMRKGSAGCTVPLHREVKRATLGDIIKQCGVAPDDFLAALK